MFLSAVTVAELRFGVACLPAGKRRDALQQNLEQQVLALFAGRVLAFDGPASRHYGALMSRASLGPGNHRHGRVRRGDGRRARHERGNPGRAALRSPGRARHQPVGAIAGIYSVFTLGSQ
ncbi:putative toxin-antitoxin system, toxin component, PIN family [Achromobacter piechaudii ATCC 43553]|uniref:Putative toxin-antitoxin system, toxin component, PIN family n=1 Tax=Achromobacter piechaudii ATCC 43553 TaxID=742159 RepID=D4XE89_9BURK|nr:putative toxin-antitoxin system, toxin component, PIN family [Achromobacter piechaudii ATCC 43553]